MHSLVYRSVADTAFILPEIYSMLSKAKEYNSEHQITGCLLYHNSSFLQLLEGEEQEVHQLFDKISKDARHHNVTIIQEEAREKRLFERWSMAFHDYGQNGMSAHLKMQQIDSFVSNSKVFTVKNGLVLPFFSNAKEILFSN